MKKHFNIKALQNKSKEILKVVVHPRAILMLCEYYKWYWGIFWYIGVAVLPVCVFLFFLFQGCEVRQRPQDYRKAEVYKYTLPHCLSCPWGVFNGLCKYAVAEGEICQT